MIEGIKTYKAIDKAYFLRASIVQMDHRGNRVNSCKLDYDWSLDNVHCAHIRLDTGLHIFDLYTLCRANILS